MTFMYNRDTRGPDHRNRLVLFPTTTYPFMIELQNSTNQERVIQQIISNNPHTKCIFDETKKYAFLVIEASNHWSLAVIINPNLLPDRISNIMNKSSNTLDTTIGTEDNTTNITSRTTQTISLFSTSTSCSAIDNKEEEAIPCIVFLNSVSTLHTPSVIAKTIRTYLAYAYIQKYYGNGTDNTILNNILSVLTEQVLPHISLPVSQQTNKYDCGIFVLEYIRTMIHNTRMVNSYFPFRVPITMKNINEAKNTISNKPTTIDVLCDISVDQMKITPRREQIKRILERMRYVSEALTALQKEHDASDDEDEGDRIVVEIISNINSTTDTEANTSLSTNTASPVERNHNNTNSSHETKP